MPNKINAFVIDEIENTNWYLIETLLNFQILNSTFEINDTINYPYVRVFYVSNLVSETEEFDLKGISMPWSIPNPGKILLLCSVSVALRKS